MSDLISQINDQMADVVDLARRSLVQVSNGKQSQGAGVIVSSDGLILTNAHVIHRQKPDVRLQNGEVLKAQVVAHDTDRDLALLKVEATDLPCVNISDTDDQKAGHWVTAIGHPWGIANSVTSGVLIDNDQIPAPEKRRGWIAASVHVRPGNSGGPLVDVHGRLLGINTVMAGPEVGLAISAQVIKSFLDDYAREVSQPVEDEDQEDPPTVQYV